ncbi:MAG: acyl-CoA thioesterase [Aureispira sp.]|nr:acyl-CoA thioesterase [Aureispira sp.]
MNPNIKSFEIRWADLDPNRHVANITFSSLMNERRMAYLVEHDFTQRSFQQHNIGPVVLKEEFNYMKEVMPNETVHIDIELLGHTADYKIVKWCHSLFNTKGQQAVYSEVLFAWFDLESRKLTVPPKALIDIMECMPKSEYFRIFSSEEIKNTQIPNKTLEL